MKALRELRKSRNITQDKLAKDLALSRSAISMYEIGASQPDFEIACKIADYFNVTVDYLVGRTEVSSPSDTPPVPTAPGSKWIPVYGDIAGGTPIEMITDIEDWEEIDADTSRRGTIFALRVRGDSMSPQILDGDVVIIRQQDDVESGEIAAVAVDGETATLKKIQKDQGGIYLVPYNHAYDTAFYTSKDIAELPIRILGKMIELRRKF